jgi:hypothetical protein
MYSKFSVHHLACRAALILTLAGCGADDSGCMSAYGGLRDV